MPEEGEAWEKEVGKREASATPPSPCARAVANKFVEQFGLDLVFEDTGPDKTKNPLESLCGDVAGGLCQGDLVR